PVPALHAAHHCQLLDYVRHTTPLFPDASTVLPAIAAAGHRIRHGCIRIRGPKNPPELGTAIVPDPDHASTLSPVLPLDATGRGQLSAEADGSGEARRTFIVTSVAALAHHAFRRLTC